MTLNTHRGMKIVVHLDNEEPDIVMLGISKATARTYSGYPLTATEARNVANWLTIAADEAEKAVRA